jgi:hypothetical protein
MVQPLVNSGLGTPVLIPPIMTVAHKRAKAISVVGYFGGLAKPGEDFGVATFFTRDAELVETVIMRKEFDAGDAWALDPVLELRSSH